MVIEFIILPCLAWVVHRQELTLSLVQTLLVDIALMKANTKKNRVD